MTPTAISRTRKVVRSQWLGDSLFVLLKNPLAGISDRVGGGRPFSGGRGTAEAADFCGQPIVAAECDCGILGDWRLRSLPQTAAHTIGRASRERSPGDRKILSSRHADQPSSRRLHAVD